MAMPVGLDLKRMKESGRIHHDRNIRVLVVDDHPLVREAVKGLIRQEPGLVICGEAEDREQTLAMISALQPHLVILDLSLKDSRGTELIGTLRHLNPKILILVLSMYDELVYAERAIRSGAHGYVSKNEPLPKIRTAIHCVLDGEIYWSEKAATRVASKIARPTGSSRPPSVQATDILSDREMQVFELIASGQSKSQIATALHIGMSTVETYRSRIKDKLKLKRASELLYHAIRWASDSKT
jgi:DNA-binding NarL/FixJ family response regulator